MKREKQRSCDPVGVCTSDISSNNSSISSKMISLLWFMMMFFVLLQTLDHIRFVKAMNDNVPQVVVVVDDNDIIQNITTFTDRQHQPYYQQSQLLIKLQQLPASRRRLKQEQQQRRQQQEQQQSSFKTVHGKSYVTIIRDKQPQQQLQKLPPNNLLRADMIQQQQQPKTLNDNKMKIKSRNKKLKKQQEQQQPPPEITVDHPYRKSGPIIQPIVGMNFYTNHSYYHDIIPPGTGKLLTKNKIHKLNINYPDLTAIIHIGPMKTGSSAIQSSFKVFVGNKVAPTDSDNYIDVTEYIQPYYSGYGVWNMIGCFRDPRAQTDNFIICKPEMLPKIHDIAYMEHKNIIISAEFLTSPDTNIPALKEFLLPWKKHRIIIYYRRYYDWINSFHNQATKQVTTQYRQKLTDFLYKESTIQFWWDRMYIINSIKRWKEYFNDIHVFNIYEVDDGDVRDSFYCAALINATNTCRNFRNQKAAALTSPTAKARNPSVAFIYEDLAYYAKEINLWSSSSLSIQDVSLKIKYYQEKILNYTKYDFGIAKECPNDDVSEYFLQQTLETERYLFPLFFKSTGEKQIRDEFALHIQTKLCHINPLTVLQQQNMNGTIWNNFFINILPTM